MLPYQCQAALRSETIEWLEKFKDGFILVSGILSNIQPELYQLSVFRRLSGC